MIYTNILDKCRLIAIYLGNTCNFNCGYCDRDYIKNNIGNQNFRHNNIDDIENFLYQIFKSSQLKIKTIAFHGGEPFLYVKRMDQILERIHPYLEKYNMDVVITTNGSLVKENEWFARKWSKYLRFTISHDFIFQEDNREYVDIETLGNLCLELGIKIMWQFVMPINNEKSFSLELVQDILNKIKYSKGNSINIIPLRHHRGNDKFKDFFSEVNLYKFSESFIQFINTLYNYGVRVMIDGAQKKVDKNYTGKHYKIILSPDGYIYPEYDFCEYKRTEFSVGQWFNKNHIEIQDRDEFKYIPVFYEQNTNKEDSLINDTCKNCIVRSECGIKYLYKLFDKQPELGKPCVLFYKIINSIISYVSKLNAKDGFYDWIIKDNMLKPCEKAIPNSPTNFKSHFIEKDNILPIKTELTFSILHKYNCFAGCEICYVDKFFEKDESKFSKFIPTDIPYEMGKLWLKVFDNYKFVSTNDDMYWLKQKQPVLFDWYKNHSSLMHFGSMTDTSFIRSHEILLNEIDTPKGIYELSFSDKWLAKVNFDKLLKQLDAVQNRSPIHVIKYIQTEIDSTEWPNSKRLFKWIKENNIVDIIHHDILGGETIVLYKDNQAMQYASYDSQVFTVCGESDYLQYDSFYLTQVEAIRNDIGPYDVLDENYTNTRHVVRHLKGKQDTYTRYYTKLQNSSNIHNKKFTEYFKFVANSMIVNENYNFIPNVSVQPYDNIYKSLLNEGWIPTHLGLYKPNDNQDVIPLYSFNK